MFRAVLLFALLLGLLALAGCSPAAQSQPPPSAPVATVAERPTSAPAARANGDGAAKPTAKPATAAAKPTAAPSAVARPASPAVAASSAKPAGQPSPAATGAARADAKPPAVVATSVAGLPAVGPSPAVAAESRGAAPADALGVAASAGSAAAANASDVEATALCGPGAILSTRAGQAVGRQATIAVSKVEASYQAGVRGQPTFLNDAPYPNHVFTAVIWGNERRQFQPPPESWQGKGLCVTGPVELFQQRPQIVVSSPSQLRAAR